jgi:hypothetical protein
MKIWTGGWAFVRQYLHKHTVWAKRRNTEFRTSFTCSHWCHVAVYEKRMLIGKFLTQGCANLGSYVAVAPKFWMVAPIIYGSSARNLPCVALRAPRILRWKICVVNEVSTRNLTGGTKCGTWYVTGHDPMTIKPQFLHPRQVQLSGQYAVFRGSLVCQPRLFLHDAAECPASM